MKIITGPTVEPVTLTEVKRQLGIGTSETGNDAEITRRITEARIWAEGYLRRSLMPQTLEIRFDQFADEMQLMAPPVSSVTSVKYIDDNGAEQTVSAADYVLDDYPPRPFVRPAYSVSWPSPRAERNAVRVQYLAGYPVEAIEAAKPITGITAATPGVVTSAAHGYANGDLIMLDVVGMTELDGALYRVYGQTTNTFNIAALSNDGAISTVGYTAFTSGTCQRVVSAVPSIIRDAIILLVGHWTNYQSRLEGEGFISRIPLAIQQMLDSEKLVTPA